MNNSRLTVHCSDAMQGPQEIEVDGSFFGHAPLKAFSLLYPAKNGCQIHAKCSFMHVYLNRGTFTIEGEGMIDSNPFTMFSLLRFRA